MSLRRFKFFLALALLLAALSAAAFVINGVASLAAYFQRGANPAAALNIVPNRPPELYVDLRWQPDAADTGRALEPFTRTEIESAYLRAWLQWNLSYLRGEPYGLRSYFNGPALQAVSDAVQQSSTQQMRVAQTNTAHRLRLHFYAADGATVAFSDEDARVSQLIHDRDGAIIFAGESQATYTVVMVLEDGTWRVRHMVRTAGAPLDAPAPAVEHEGFVARIGSTLMLNGNPFYSAGINYYPQATPWDRFWPAYDPQVIERDFTRMRTLGLNSVRIFIPFQQFSGPNVDAVMLDRLADLLQRARTHDLKIIVTLFDFRTDYNPLLWPQSDRHLRTILSHFADEPAILAWDLKNEPDRDYAAGGKAIVDAWLAHTARLARAHAPNHLLTIGWSTPDAAHTLTAYVDLVSFHFYAPAADLPAAYVRLRAMAPDRPIVLGEFGLPTWNSFFFPHGHSEDEQARYYADILATLRTMDSAGYLAWTLYDFEHVPASVAGRWPWQTGPQAHLGILRADGTPKPAAALLAPNSTLDVPTVPALARFVKPFWLMLYTVSGALAMATFLALRRRR